MANERLYLIHDALPGEAVILSKRLLDAYYAVSLDKDALNEFHERVFAAIMKSGRGTASMAFDFLDHGYRVITESRWAMMSGEPQAT